MRIFLFIVIGYGGNGSIFQLAEYCVININADGTHSYRTGLSGPRAPLNL
ncbi:Uncharacterised protein [Providencia rettgeri]|nr:Uncharacterised protein [Providencia rettgeri]